MTVVVSSRAEEHIGMGGKNLNLLNPMNPGRGAAHPAAPFRLAALATHPREGGASNMEEENVALKTCRLWVERDREAAEGGIIKLIARRAIPPPSARRAVAP